MFLVSFFSSNQCGRAAKKTQSAGKNTIFEQAIPDPDNHKGARIVPTVDLLVTLFIHSHSSREKL